ncbi:MAG: bifunctional glutamate N-acetyltransferase/amino-acid acetyltransferase ArgJ [Phycisphaerae bacterium]
MSTTRHVTLPAGFVAAGVKCGIKASGKPDLAIIAGEADCACAIMTTTNQVFGEPVRWCRNVLPKGYGRIRGIVINAGCANVCTGKAGYRDAVEMATLTAKHLSTGKQLGTVPNSGTVPTRHSGTVPPSGTVPSCTPSKVLVASTGIIGHRLPMDKVRAGIADAAGRLGRDNDTDALHAMMTTDTRDKYAVVQEIIGGRLVTVAGIVKGAGMIAPSMATMISVITTDAAVAPPALHKALKSAAGATFNAITVDSDTSTSDTVVVLASGRAGNAPIPAGAWLQTAQPRRRADYRKFAAALHEVCAALARAVASDGEGATKLVEIAVRGARSDAEAAIAAKSVANSPLFKCAVHGGDPNWGRIAAALGKSAAKIDPAKLVIAIGGVTLFARGAGRSFDLKKVTAHLAGGHVLVSCDLGLGAGRFTALTCDLSREYIAINADYHT